MVDKLIYPRMLGYVFTIALHVGHLVYLGLTQNIPNHPDPDVKRFADMRHRFFTCWNFGIQIFYAATGLLCDYLVLKNAHNKNYRLPKRLEKFRDTLFAGVLWPSTWLVATVFWPIFIYDRSLIFPIFVDKVLSKTSNHIIHSIIVPIVVWEVIFRPREVPKSHKWNLAHLAFHMLLYTAVLFYSHAYSGMWLYPIFDVLYETVYFPFFLIFLLSLTFVYYYMQWIPTAFIHRQGNVVKSDRRKYK